MPIKSSLAYYYKKVYLLKLIIFVYILSYFYYCLSYEMQMSKSFQDYILNNKKLSVRMLLVGVNNSLLYLV